MSKEIKRGVAIIHYDRLEHLGEVVEAVSKTMPPDARLVICDDGTKGDVRGVLPGNSSAILVQGPNKGVGYNKNRALWGLQDCHFLALIEDDLKPIESGWFEAYEKFARETHIHHFCRIQDKERPDFDSSFTDWCTSNIGLTPLFGTSPRGDFTFITSRVLYSVGAFNPNFMGVGFAHGEWSERIFKANLISHPLKWIDVKEARDKFIQIGDTEGGRWNQPRTEIRKQIRQNEKTKNSLDALDYVYHPLILS